MTEIPIYDSEGTQVDSITINESSETVKNFLIQDKNCDFCGVGKRVDEMLSLN
jgi:hypothetical protein